MLKDKKILVLGAGGLLGSSIVSAALDSGATVIAADIDLAHLKTSLIEKSIFVDTDKLVLMTLDINNVGMMNNYFDKETSLNGVVNAVYPRNSSYGADFLDVKLENFNENVSLNIGGTFLLSQCCARYFLRTDIPFSLVNISSIYGVVAPKFEIYEGTSMTMPVEYAVIKSSLLHLNKFLSAYIKNSSFRVNSVSPGGVFDQQNPRFLGAYGKHTRGKGMLDAKDIVGSILFLLSDLSQYITGQNIIVDDGFTL
jgi:NAD(P)-dependent dehydrogenase (short-subunit alcohol dehydrogenase family)